MLFPTIVAAVVMGMYLLYRRRRKHFSLFKDNGIPGPEPSLLTGNFKEIQSEGMINAFGNWITKYGNVVGYFHGSVPFLLINKVDVLKKIMVRDAASFTSRGTLLGTARHHPLGKCSLSVTFGKQWKKTRAVVSPAFKPSVVKEVFEAASWIADDLVASLETSDVNNCTVNVDAPTGPVRKATMQLLARFLFGAELPPSGTEEFPDDFKMLADSKNPKKVCIDLGKISFLPLFFSEYSTLWSMLIKIRVALFGGALREYEQKIDSFIARHSSDARKSALSIMVQEAVENHRFNGHSPQKDPDESRLNMYEIRSNLISLVVSGYDSLANGLCFTMYLLAKHEDVQAKVRNEVLSVQQRLGTLNYANISNLTYLEQVILESLRLFPPLVNFGTRTAEANSTYDGIIIPKGVSVVAPNFDIHRDPKIWPDHELFLPERFSAENKANLNADAYQAFGLGPRKCVAERLSMLYMQLVLSRVMTEFCISLDEDRHKDEITLQTIVTNLHAKDGIWLKFRKLSTSPAH